MGASAKFWDRIAERYARRPVADEAAYQKKLEITRRYFTPESEVLELGCGTGSTAIAHAPHVKRIKAVDISAKMLEIAKGKAESAGVRNIAFEQSTVDAFSAPDASFDVVLALSVLHLLEDKEAAMAKIYRLLKPGGVFVTSTACLGDFMPVFRFIAPIGRFFGFFPLVKVFTRKQLKQSLSATGFAIDHEWLPGKNAAVFIVAKKPA